MYQISASNTGSYVGSQENKDFNNLGSYQAGNTFYYQGKSNTIGVTTLPALSVPNFSCNTLLVTVNGTDGTGQIETVSIFRWIVNSAGVVSLESTITPVTGVTISGWSLGVNFTNATPTAASSVSLVLTTTTVGAIGVSGTLSFVSYP